MTGPAWRRNGRLRLEGVHVLVVDDDSAVREVVTALLVLSGARVTAVGSAEEALVAVQEESPDVLLSDLTMPGKGGYWLIEQVRALPPERGGITPAAALTAHSGPESTARVLGAGFQVHVEKPIGLGAVIATVAQLAPQRSSVELG